MGTKKKKATSTAKNLATAAVKTLSALTKSEGPSAAPVFTREQALRTGRIAIIPGHTRTRDQLERELASIPGDFIRTKVTPILLVREAEEMLQFRADAPAFASRGIDVTEGHFQLIDDLCSMLREAAGLRDVADTARAGFDEMEDSHAIQIRQLAKKLRLLAQLSGLSPELAALGEAQGNLRVLDAGQSILARVRPHISLFRPANEAQSVLDELEATVKAMSELRAHQAGETGTKLVGTDRIHRIKRLLLDTLRYVGAAGEYVFDGDATRAAAYQLQHISQMSNRARKKTAPTMNGASAAVDDLG